jgi:hypothetical protein
VTFTSLHDYVPAFDLTQMELAMNTNKFADAPAAVVEYERVFIDDTACISP